MYSKGVFQRFRPRFINQSVKHQILSSVASTSSMQRAKPLSIEMKDVAQSFYPSMDLRSKFWDQKMLQRPQVLCSYDDAEQHHIAIHAQLRKYGICLVDNAPTQLEWTMAGDSPVIQLGNAMGSVRDTNYGKHFDLIQTPDSHTLVADGRLVHTDDPYRDPVPTVQILHCVCLQNNQEMSTFTDRLMAANLMRQRYPDEFKLLSTVRRLFTYYDLDSGRLFRKYQYVIQLDASGAVESVHFNNRTTSSHHWNIESSTTLIGPYYKAWAQFGALLDDPNKEYSVDYRLMPGQIVLFDNNRMLHSQRSGNVGHLQGCYIDFDSMWAQDM